MVFEEEDFQPMQYGYRLNPDIFEQKIIGMLKEIEEDLHKKSRLKNPDIKVTTEVGCENILNAYKISKLCCQ